MTNLEEIFKDSIQFNIATFYNIELKLYQPELLVDIAYTVMWNEFSNTNPILN